MCIRDSIRFVEDNWESPTLGAWGLGWEVWLDGMETVSYTHLFLAVIAVVGTVAAFVKNYRLEVVRPDGKVEEHDLGFLEDEE